MKPTHCSGIRALSPKPRLVTTSTAVDERCNDIRHTLLERRRELLNEIQSNVRDVRELGSSNNRHHSADLRDTVETDPEDDLAFALIQMRAETLENVNEAIRRVDEGTYGYCVDCNEVIASSRLQAMPFAVRCRDCAGTLEDEQQRERVQSQRSPSGFGSRY